MLLHQGTTHSMSKYALVW